MNQGTLFRIWARRDAIDQVEYAKEIGPKVLKYFEKTFNVEYPLPKMDMIAIPDFSAGAMENWGKFVFILPLKTFSSNTNHFQVWLRTVRPPCCSNLMFLHRQVNSVSRASLPMNWRINGSVIW